jgi:mono/diheme cytochrome c family protein
VRKIATITVLVLAACGSGNPDAPTVPGRWYSQPQIEAGQALYVTHCIVCHGADGSATADWRTPGPDGKYPPPPLNGTAHTWHHSLAMLSYTIENGGAEFNGMMPAFAGVLDQQQRLAVIAYLQNWWPDDTYAKWLEIDARGR